MAPLQHPAAGRSSHLTHDDQKEVTRCNRKPGPATSQSATRQPQTAKPRLYYKGPCPGLAQALPTIRQPPPSGMLQFLDIDVDQLTGRIVS